jgi:AraC-like DNA-binding protein
MSYWIHTPRFPLSIHIHSLWLYENDHFSGGVERALPSATMEIVINLRNEPLRIFTRPGEAASRSFRNSVVSGPQARFFDGELPLRTCLLGVHFKPGGAYPFFGQATELLNLFESLDVFWGHSAVILREKLLEAYSPACRFRILESFLLSELKTFSLNSAVAATLNDLRWVFKSRPVAQVAKQVGISPKHFIELFSREVGLTPKLFCRIQRFQSILRLAETTGEAQWAALATASGYYDQAHLIHEFRDLAGYTPSQYVKRKTGRANHVAVEAG